MFDGNGTEVSTLHGPDIDSACFNNSFQYIPFGESKNITIQVSLILNKTYVKIDYGILERRLDSGKERETLFFLVRNEYTHNSNYLHKFWKIIIIAYRWVPHVKYFTHIKFKFANIDIFILIIRKVNIFFQFHFELVKTAGNSPLGGVG